MSGIVAGLAVAGFGIFMVSMAILLMYGLDHVSVWVKDDKKGATS